MVLVTVCHQHFIPVCNWNSLEGMEPGLACSECEGHDSILVQSGWQVMFAKCLYLNPDRRIVWKFAFFSHSRKDLLHQGSQNFDQVDS